MRKICVVVASRANYGRVKYVLKAIQSHPNLELQLVVAASALLDKYGNVEKTILKDGFSIAHRVYYVIEGDNLEAKAKSTGFGIIELTSVFSDLKPDVVVTVADRFETMATAVAASYLNIPLAHIQGGEVTGNIDELVRHAITKLSHYHFPATKDSYDRIIRMGEEPWRVLQTGCPSIDTICNQSLELAVYKKELDNVGVGYQIDWDKPYILVLQHPVTTEYENGREQILETLYGLREFEEQKIIMWPNIDAGADLVSKGIRLFRESHINENYFYVKNFSPEAYNAILYNTICAVGNSSSFIREGSYLGTPAVEIGNRQNGRERSENVICCGYSREEIANCVKQQIKHGRYHSDNRFGDGHAGITMAEYLSDIDLSVLKKITY